MPCCVPDRGLRCCSERSEPSGADAYLLANPLENLTGYLVATDDHSGALAAARESIGIHAAREPDDVRLGIAIEHLALVIALCADCVRAARLEGYADAAFARHGFAREFTETATHNRLTALLRETLSPDELARLIAEGAALTPEAAIALPARGAVAAESQCLDASRMEHAWRHRDKKSYTI